jgi:hypothetical protein
LPRAVDATRVRSTARNALVANRSCPVPACTRPRA